jgi:multidrug efflux pump subunit AcrB
LIVLVAIPTSLITAFAVMWLLGYTLNLMTLLAMSLIIGILVDDATVVLENIQRHLDMGKEKERQLWTEEWKLVFLHCLLPWLMWLCFCRFYFYRFLLPICSNSFR